MDAREVPPPPWLPPEREGRARALSREAIVEAALRVLEREGPQGLSMRRVARELGTGAASLYWHVQDKEQLIELLVDRVMSELEPPPPDPSRWEEQLIEWGLRAREVLRRHPGVGALTLGRIPVGPNMVRWTEWLLGLLRAAGIPDRIAAFAGDLLGLYVGAFAMEEAMELRAPTGETLPPERIVGMLRSYFESLPPDRFPNIRETIDDLFAGGPDERYRLGMEVIVRGLATYAREEGGGRRARRGTRPGGPGP
ncbi:MAG TPA: TetR/AcrR family transcriptional regulator [Actinomycetota bacterium]|nr:TetR/AcrR family transcriptional regulator [Actinomycetota bacterium]